MKIWDIFKGMVPLESPLTAKDATKHRMKDMRRTGLLLITSFITCHVLAANSNTDWSTHLGNAAHTSYANVNVNYDAMKPLWSVTFPVPEKGYLFLGQPIVTKDTIFLNTTGFDPKTNSYLPAQILALNTAKGELRWKIEFASKHDISGITYELVKDKFECEYRGKISAKNKGEIDMFFVEKPL